MPDSDSNQTITFKDVVTLVLTVVGVVAATVLVWVYGQGR